MGHLSPLVSIYKYLELIKTSARVLLPGSRRLSRCAFNTDCARRFNNSRTAYVRIPPLRLRTACAPLAEATQTASAHCAASSAPSPTSKSLGAPLLLRIFLLIGLTLTLPMRLVWPLVASRVRRSQAKAVSIFQTQRYHILAGVDLLPNARTRPSQVNV